MKVVVQRTDEKKKQALNIEGEIAGVFCLNGEEIHYALKSDSPITVFEWESALSIFLRGALASLAKDYEMNEANLTYNFLTGFVAANDNFNRDYKKTITKQIKSKKVKPKKSKK